MWKGGGDNPRQCCGNRSGAAQRHVQAEWLYGQRATAIIRAWEQKQEQGPGRMSLLLKIRNTSFAL